MSNTGKKRSSSAAKKSSRRAKVNVHDDPVILPSLAPALQQAPLSLPPEAPAPIAVPAAATQAAPLASSPDNGAPSLSPAVDTRVLQTHSRVAQPSAAQLRALLGDPVPQRLASPQPTLFAQQRSDARNDDITDVDGNMPNDAPLRRTDEQMRDSIDNRLRQSKAPASKSVAVPLHSAEQVHSRARIGQTDDSATDSFATDSLLREIDAAGDTVVSRIDQLIANANNRSAAQTINTKVRHGAAAGIAGVLGEKGQQRVQSIDEFVERVLNLSSMVNVSQELKDKPFVVTGLSATEANPDWSNLQAERSAVEERRKQLILQRQLMAQDRMTQSRSAIVDRARRRESVRQRIMQYEPIDAVQLLKPESEVRRLNELWRTLLGQTLVDIYNEHKDITTKSYADASRNLPPGEPIAANPDSVCLLYMQRVVNPVLNNYVVQLQTATYEDMPLTQEVLSTYLAEFLDAVLNTLLEEAAAQSADAVARTLAEQEAAASRAPPAALEWEERAAQLLQKFDRPYNEEPLAYTGMSPEERERVLFNSYVRQALYIYATPIYEQWFGRWRDTAGVSRIASSGVRNGAALLASLERAVKNIVTSRAEAEQRRRAATLNNVPSYQAPNNATIVAQFRQLMVAQIALARCDAVLAQADQSQWENALRSALAAADGTDLNTVIDIELLVRPRIDRYEILERATKQREDTIDSAYADIDEADLAAVARREEEKESLDVRKRTIAQLITLWSPINQAAIRRHAPNDAPDGADPGWQPFNLLYPLTIDAVQRQQPALAEKVRLFADVFDADAAHERAGELRSILSFGYAEQLVDRELMRIDYALRNFAQPTIAVPLSTAVAVESQIPIHLSAQLELRPQLALILEAPSDAMRDPDIVALNESLFSTPIAVKWWFRPVLNALGVRSANEEPRLLKEETLAANSERKSSLQIDGPGTDRAGYYWVEMTIGGTLYRSLFTAEVRVLCRCVRDSVVYEVGTETFGQCKWSEFPRSKELTDAVAELTVLVEKGYAARQQLIRRREYNLEQYVAGFVNKLTEPPYLPPWGTDDEESLVDAFQRIGNSNDEFMYDSILARILHRLALQMRSGDIKVSDDMSDLSLVVLLTDSTITEDDPDTFVLQTYNVERSQNGDFAAPEARNTDSVRVPVFYRDDVGERIRRAQFFRNIKLDPTSVFEIGERVLQAIPNEAIPVLRYYSRTSTAPERIPLATMLYLLYTPLVYANLTWRERRFISSLRSEFDSQLFAWRQTLEKQLRQAASVEDQSWWRARDGPLVGPVALEREIWRRITALTPTQAAALNTESVEVSPLSEPHGSASNILFDRALRAEFDLLVDDHLVRHGLVVTHAATKKNPITGWLYTSIEKTLARSASSNATAGNTYRTILERPQWIGAHTHLSTQPDLYDLAADNRGVAVLKRGSIPTHKGYDFEGLDAFIQGLTLRVTTLRRSVSAAAVNNDDTTAPDYPELTKTANLLQDLVNAYNYLAFCSTPLPFRETLSAHEIVELVAARDSTNFFARLRQQRRQAGGIDRPEVLVH